MEAGESYTFRVTFEPENTAYPYLRWYSSDESVIRIDGLSFTVTALAPGNAVIYAESLDSVSHAVCSLQVSGDKIMITDEQGVMRTWHVSRNTKIPADGFAEIAGDLKDNMLVLITCEDESVSGGYLHRRVVFADHL